MLQTDDNQAEILLGNKQLLGIFFVIAVLLGVAFTGGYMVGKSSGEKKPAPAPASTDNAPPTAPGAPVGGETHSVPAASGAETPQDAVRPPEIRPAKKASPIRDESGELPLGSPNRKAEMRKQESEPAGANSAFTPQSGQMFLQVAAVGRDEAEAVADVLHKKGFRAHAVPKPGNANLYRILIGPIRDAADLSSTRDNLRKVAGFREVIVQRY